MSARHPTIKGLQAGLSAAERAWHKKTEKWAETMIREKVDLAQVFDAEALYESTGEQLRGFLAYAYRCGQLASADAKNKAKV